MRITFLSENLGLAISTNSHEINENERSWSVQKGFFFLFFLHFGSTVHLVVLSVAFFSIKGETHRKGF